MSMGCRATPPGFESLSTQCYLCDPRQVTYTFCASVSWSITGPIPFRCLGVK